MKGLESGGLGVNSEGGFAIDLSLGEGGDNLSAFDTGTWTKIDEVGGDFDGVFVVLDKKEGVSFFFQGLKGAEERGVVARVESNGWFVENVEDALKVGSELGSEADTLGFASGEGGGGAVNLEVAKADVIEEFEALGDFRKNVA